MKYFPKISRGNIYLSPINIEDYEIMTKWMNDSRITDGINNTKTILSIQKEKEFIENIAKDDDPSTKAFAIIKKKEDKLLGIVDLGRINYIDQTATIGIGIGDIQNHNKGYGTDAINAILLYGFHTLNLRNIDLHVFAFNEGAIRCYQKVGFMEYGRRKDMHYCNGKFWDEIAMDITKEYWEEKNKEILNAKHKND